MPITFTNVSGFLDITIVDDNFGDLAQLFKEGILTADLADSFTSYSIRRYEFGKIMSMTIGLNPYLPQDMLLTYGVFESDFNGSGQGPIDTDYQANYFSGQRPWMQMELLGRPGKTFYFDWQEDGYADPATYVGAPVTGWPPSGWPWGRYPANYCYSYWLTVPFAAGRVFVKEPCVARITGHAKGALRMSPIMLRNNNAPPIGAQRFIDGVFRFGLFVDTNPELHADEFATSNPNIDGSYCSWKKVEDKTFRGEWINEIEVSGNVELKGNRRYNFSLKHRQANTISYLDHTGAPVVFFTDDWEDGGLVNFNTWNAGLGPFGVAPPFQYCGIFPYTKLWESTTIHVEFFYGRDDADINSYLDAEFDTVP